MRAVKSVSIDSERRVIITFLDGSTETLYPNLICCDAEALREIIKELLEEKADAIVQTINNVTVATFEDGADEALIRKLLVSIEPIQEGTGDPSPENVRPIIGRTRANVSRTRFNIWNEEWEVGGISESGIDITSTTNIRSKDYIMVLPSTAYYFYVGSNVNMRYYYYDESKNFILWGDGNNVVRTTPENARYLRFRMVQAYGTTYKNNICINFSNPTKNGTYESYEGNTYSVNWEAEAGTVYGGSLDIVSGKLTVDREYIASYNGESLPSTWISDRDVYAEGTTPTTGAEVVYQLSEPVVYLLTPQEVTTLLGDNNIWADSGDILELEYVADTKLYIGESQSGTFGSGRQSISNTDLQPASEKTVEDLTEAVKTETAEKETQEETEDERGE